MKLEKVERMEEIGDMHDAGVRLLGDIEFL